MAATGLRPGIPVTGPRFGHIDHMVLAECGDMTLIDGHVKGSAEGPKPLVDGVFSPGGEALYVVDTGALAMMPTALAPMPHPFPQTGVVWRITRETGSR